MGCLEGEDHIDQPQSRAGRAQLWGSHHHVDPHCTLYPSPRGRNPGPVYVSPS